MNTPPLFRTLSSTLLLALAALWLLDGCRTDDEWSVPSSRVNVDTTRLAPNAEVVGFYLLNEGNMGMNKCTLDYYDATTGQYHRNIFSQINPGVVQELGDVGNDLQIYDGKLWAVINCSHFVEVMEQQTAHHITQISIPNCRYICFKGRYAYVSSYAGPVQIDPNARLGYVAKIDTHTLQLTDTCNVGYQPEQMAVVGSKLYVANSGGYRVPNYDRTVSVIDLNTFKVMKTIDVAINLHRVVADAYGQVWVSSRGDYYGDGSRLFCINSQTDTVTDSINIATSGMTLANAQSDSLYVYGTEWNYATNQWTVNYAIVNVRTHEVLTRNFITDGTEKTIQQPYGIRVNPDNADIYVTDAGNFVTPGYLYCFSADGKQKWRVRAGDIPAHFAFTTLKVAIPE